MTVGNETDPRKVRVLYVGPAFAPTGTSVVMREILNRLDRSRFQPAVIVHRSNEIRPTEWVAADVHRYDLRGSTIPTRLARRIWFAWKLVSILHKGRYNCVITDLRSFIYPILLLKRLKALPVPIVVRWGGMASVTTKGWPALERRIINFLLPSAAVIVTPALLGKEDLTTNFGLDPERIRVVGNFVDPQELRRRSLDVPVERPAGPVVLFVGSIAERKAPRTLLTAFASVAEDHPDATLWFVGDGAQREELESRSRDLGIAGQVVFHGRQANPYPYYQAADIFVHCSPSDGFAIALLEAAAFHLPILYADEAVGITAEMKRAAIGTPFRGEAQLADHLGEWLRSPELVDTATYDEFVAGYSGERFIAAYERAIEEASGTGRGSG